MHIKKTHTAEESPAVYGDLTNRPSEKLADSKRPILKKESASLHLRIKEVIGDEPVASFGRRSQVSESLLRAYISGEKRPGVDRLVSIAEIGGVTVDWLATGRLPKFRTDLKNAVSAPDPLNPAQLRMALVLTEESARVQPLSADQRADMVLAFYYRLTKGDAS